MWIADTLHVIDFEGSSESGIIEFGIVTLKDNQIIKTDTELCRSIGAINKQSYSQHKISNKDTENSEPFASYLPIFESLRKKGSLFAAHHASVENSFLKRVHFPIHLLCLNLLMSTVQIVGVHGSIHYKLLKQRIHH